MTPHEKDRSPLSPQRAFVLHFRAVANLAEGLVTGRVEHVMSGQATHFESLDHLLAFIQQILAAETPQEQR